MAFADKLKQSRHTGERLSQTKTWLPSLALPLSNWYECFSSLTSANNPCPPETAGERILGHAISKEALMASHTQIPLSHTPGKMRTHGNAQHQQQPKVTQDMVMLIPTALSSSLLYLPLYF